MAKSKKTIIKKKSKTNLIPLEKVYITYESNFDFIIKSFERILKRLRLTWELLNSIVKEYPYSNDETLVSLEKILENNLVSLEVMVTELKELFKNITKEEWSELKQN